MYKCSECGNEYETAPKYCRCGNDIFISVEGENEFISQEIEDDIESPAQTSRYHGGGRNFRKKTFSPVSLSVFAFCIILSLLVLFVIGNPKKDLTETEIKKIAEEKIEIPSVDAYWDDTPASTGQKEEPKQENIIEKIVQQIVPQQPKEVKPAQTTVKTPVATPKTTVQTTVKTQPQKTVQKTATSKQSASKTSSKQTTNQSGSGMTFGDLANRIRNQYPAQNTKTQTQSKPTSQTTQTTKQSAPLPQTTNKTKQTVTAQTQTQTTQKTPAQTAPKPQTQPTTQTQVQTQVQTQTKTQTAAVVVPQKSQAQLRQELSSYKSGLSTTIGRKIDFTKVIGDGECALSFKINSNGRLTSKTFTKQSSNITLNDAAFNALNTMTSYNPPPEGYNGETLHLTIKFYNGNFEISLN